MPDDLVIDAGRGVLAGGDPLTAFMFFTILILLGALAVLYRRNQKQNDDTVQLVKDGMAANQEVVKILTILSERIENALKGKS